MKVINFENGQSGEDWLKWRRSLITASDSSVIMGVNPYTDLTELRLRKLSLIPETSCSPAMQRGKDLENSARESFHKDNPDINFTPMVVESSEYPFLGASLDGITQSGKHIIEIKCPGKKNMQLARNGEVLPYYQAQMQHQLLVTGADICYYYCYDGKEGHTIEVYPDKDWQKEYLPKAEEFWMSLIFDKE